MPKTFYIDFDRVIHDIDHPVEGRKMGPPMEGAVSGMQQLREAGHRLVVFTIRATNERSTKVVMDWLDYYECPYDSVTNIKGKADAYVDDLAVHHVSWDQTIRLLDEQS